jgi:hypothetical protein
VSLIAKASVSKCFSRYKGSKKSEVLPRDFGDTVFICGSCLEKIRFTDFFLKSLSLLMKIIVSLR